MIHRLNWKWKVLLVISADQTIEGFGQMLEPLEPTGHRLQILVKLSVTAEKQTFWAQKTTNWQNHR